MLTKLIKILRRNRFKNTGKNETILQRTEEYIADCLSSLRGKLERIKEVVLFIPVIYSAVRWDYSSLFKILEHWLGRMEDCHNKDSQHLDAPRYAKQLRICRILAGRLANDDYETQSYEELDQKWGESEFSFGEPDKDGLSVVIISRKNRMTEENYKEYIKDNRRLHVLSNYRREQDLEFLSKTIKKNYTHWWC